MSYDITYRPRTYDDVLGQEATIEILKHFVSEGQGFQQSYLFCGPHGTGKTTLGRILGRSLLCERPCEGSPCDECNSCLSLLKSTSMDFIEVDAATNSGKADVKGIVDDIRFSSFSGRRRIYLFDEAHQLSKEALDALLKPLEENRHGSLDKQLVCIFCTTEPEKMRTTVLSRCAPAFVLENQTPAVIASRLKWVCEREGVKSSDDALLLIAESCDSHIRDALKSLQMVSLSGEVSLETVSKFLILDADGDYIRLLTCLNHDLDGVITSLGALLGQTSPQVVYKKLLSCCMEAFYCSLGQSPTTWDRASLSALSERGEELLGFAQYLSGRPKQLTTDMLRLDLMSLHYGQVGSSLVAPPRRVVVQREPPSLGHPEKTTLGEVSSADLAMVKAQQSRSARNSQREKASQEVYSKRRVNTLSPHEYVSSLKSLLSENL